MRVRTLLAVLVTAPLAAACTDAEPVLTAPPQLSAAAGAQRLSFEAVLVDTEILFWPPPGPGGDWVSAGIWHVRGIEIRERIEGGLVGTLERSVSFNLNLATGKSTAWCHFTMTVTEPIVETWEGSCRGSLATGTFNGHGQNGTLIRGTYDLAPGGEPGVGPYGMAGSILLPGGGS